MVKKMWTMFLNNYFKHDEPMTKEKQHALLVEEARKEWHSARKTFEEAVEPDLVEHAIFHLKAAERRYMHLLKIARSEQIKLDEDMVLYLPLVSRNQKTGQ